MNTEIERKFLVTGNAWRTGCAGQTIRQGYLAIDTRRQVRVRVAGGEAWLTIKYGETAISRLEFEYPIPVSDALQLLENLCLRPVIEKTRYPIRHGGHTWHIDEFHGANAGLVVAEIELSRTDETFKRPQWLGTEVSEDPRYLNANLVNRPFCDWAAES